MPRTPMLSRPVGYLSLLLGLIASLFGYQQLYSCQNNWINWSSLFDRNNLCSICLSHCCNHSNNRQQCVDAGSLWRAKLTADPVVQAMGILLPDGVAWCNLWDQTFRSSAVSLQIPEKAEQLFLKTFIACWNFWYLCTYWKILRFTRLASKHNWRSRVKNLKQTHSLQQGGLINH